MADTIARQLAYGMGSPLHELPPIPVLGERAPLTSDINYPVGQDWIRQSTGQVWKMIQVVANSATWSLTGPGASDVDTLTGDGGGAISPAGGNITLAGGTNVTTSGAGSTITFNLDAAPTLAGLLTCNASATILTAGTALNLGSDNSGDAVNLAVGTTARAVGIANSAAAHTVTVGSLTGIASLDLQCGTGNFTINGVAGTTYNIGAATTTGTVTIGGTSQTGNFVLAPSDGIMIMSMANSDGTKTINIGAGVDGNTISLGSGINTSAQIINVATGASAADSTINVLSGNGTAGTQTFNMLTGTRAGALNLATGAAAHVIIVGSASAGAITVDTAAGISLDGATASNFTVTGAAIDLTLASVGGSVNLDGSEAVVDAIRIQASDAAGGIDIDAGTGGIDILTTGAFSLDGTTSSNISLAGAGADLTIASASGRVIVDGGEAGSDAVTIVAGSGGIDMDAALQINITSPQAAADAILLNASNAAGGIQLTAGTAGVQVSGNLILSAVATQLQMNGGAATDFIGQATLVLGTVTVNNTNIAATDKIYLSRSGAAASTTLGELSYTISAGASFTITALQTATPGSTQTGDVSIVEYIIVRQN